MMDGGTKENFKNAVRCSRDGVAVGAVSGGDARSGYDNVSRGLEFAGGGEHRERFGCESICDGSRKLNTLVFKAAEEANKIGDKIERYKAGRSAVIGASGLESLIKVAEMEKRLIERKKKSAESVTSDGDPVSCADETDENRVIKSFSSLDESIFPVKKVDGSYAFLCPNNECNKTFPSISRAKRHYIIHTGLRPFKCPNKDCTKMFSRKDNMLQHFRIHCKYTRRRCPE